MTKLEDKVAVVTGAARGIGAGIAKRLKEEGAVVAVLDMDQEQAEEIARELDPTGEKVFAMKCNVADKKEVDKVFGSVIEKYGKVDILVNNAGITRDAIFHKMTKEQWDTVINVNLTSMFNTCQAVVPKMREQKYGKIVNVASSSAWGNAGQANYGASKAGVMGLTRTLAKELGRYNVTVNAIAPGLIETDMTRAMPKEIFDQAAAMIPRGTYGQPSEVAGVVSFLSSDDSSFVNGVCIHVNGGLLIN